MTKAVSLSICLVILLASAAQLRAQTNATDMAIRRAVQDQAYTIVLRQKLEDAKVAAASGDLAGAAKIYEEAYAVSQQIGSGIDVETARAMSGLTATRLTLAKQAQGRGDLQEADTDISRVLKVDPKNAAALAMKKQNDEMIAAQVGTVPDRQTTELIPAMQNDKTQAATLVRDGKLLFEMGKLEEANVKLNEALKLDPDNEAAFYYLNLVQQA
ncbi:MAG TPA: tetratricopeptide repeat protein, partial [Verrucomicrobiae bacterium]